MSTKKADKIIGIELLRILLCWFVVVVHLWSDYEGSPFAFIFNYTGYTVPVFFIISFYFCQKWISSADKGKLISRTKRLIIPYFIWDIAACLYYILINNFHFKFIHIYHQLVFGCGINNVLWFQYDMIIITIVFWFICKVFRDKADFVIIGLTIFAYYLQYSGINYDVISQINSIEMYTLGRFAEVFPMATCGYFISKSGVNNLILKHPVFSAIINLILVVFIAKYEPFRFVEEGFYLQGIAVAIVAIFIFELFFVIKIPEGKVKNFILLLGSASPAPYYMHLIIGAVLVLRLHFEQGSMAFCTFVWAISMCFGILIRKCPVEWIKKSLL